MLAGPPPDVPPALAEAPAPPPHVGPLALPRRPGRRVVLLLAAAVAVAAIFGAGYGVGQNGGSSSPAAWSVALSGTTAAPAARATLDVLPGEDGNWPMHLRVTGLAALPPHGQYEVYLLRDGKPWASCGTFVVGASKTASVTLNAPYPLHRGDRWVVTRELPGHAGRGPTVLRPA